MKHFRGTLFQSLQSIIKSLLAWKSVLPTLFPIISLSIYKTFSIHFFSLTKHKRGRGREIGASDLSNLLGFLVSSPLQFVTLIIGSGKRFHKPDPRFCYFWVSICYSRFLSKSGDFYGFDRWLRCSRNRFRWKFFRVSCKLFQIFWVLFLLFVLKWKNKTLASLINFFSMKNIILLLCDLIANLHKF